MISIKIDYKRELKPVYIESMEASHVYMNDLKKATGQAVEYKIKDQWVEFNEIKTRKSVLADSLFLRFMSSSIVRKKRDGVYDSPDFIVLRFKYGANYRSGGVEKKISKHDLRILYYKNGVDYTFEKKNKDGEIVEQKKIHYKMLMRSPGKAKSGNCVFIRESLHKKAINYLTMGFYELMDEQSKNDPDKVFRLVELSAYQTLTTAKADGFIRIPLENILIVEDKEVYSNGMKAAIVKNENNECTVTISEDEKIKNVLWDGMGLIDDDFFPEDMEGFIYCRSHFFKSCLFRGNVQQFFKDYCEERDLNYDTYTVEDVDMFQRKIKLCDVKVIITDKSIKWIKFIDLMGGTQQKAYKYYGKWMRQYDYYFSIVKSAHKSKLGDFQLSTYQINNSLPTTDKKVLRKISDNAINIINDLKMSDEKYLQYLKMKTDGKNDRFSIDKVMLELVKWNRDFMKTEFFRTKKSNDICKIKADFCEGRLPQIGDNLTIMDNPIALLLAAVGDKNPLDEGCFQLREDGVECYTTRFKDGEDLAAFRSPHNSPNNIIHLYNVWSDKLMRYFPNIGNNVIVFNAIKTDTQCRLSGHDVDSDFVYVTNQKDLADLAKKAYVEYPTIINKISESGTSNYHFTLEDYAEMDNTISDAQVSIGTSTDVAQLALSYYYDGNMKDSELEKCFIILSVIGQISIDLAKKSFDVDVVKEIRRIKNLPCMGGKYIPRFFADTKKNRNNTEYSDDVIKSMNCPMDIMANQIKEDVISYAPRRKHILFRNLLNKEISGRGIRYKKEKIIEQARLYNKRNTWIETHKSDVSKSGYYLLRQRSILQFLHSASNNLDQETVMQLMIFAIQSDNSDICGTILNFLYDVYRDEFLNCFIKNEQKTEVNFTKNL